MLGPVTETHVRNCRVVISRRELESIIKAHVIRLSGFYGEATEVTLRFEDELEGSPSYRVGTKCVADLVEDQLKIPQADPA